MGSEEEDQKFKAEAKAVRLFLWGYLFHQYVQKIGDRVDLLAEAACGYTRALSTRDDNKDHWDRVT